jgi:hypothetical protein
MQTNLPDTNKWSFMQKIFFRFFASYFIICIFPFPVGSIPFTHTVEGWYDAFINFLISLIGKHFLYINFPLAPTSNGSGDTTYNYIQLFLFVVLTIIGTIIWSVADRNRKNYNLFSYWLITYIRFYVGLTMIRYGFEKTVKAQFAFPYYALNETYGQSSPMRLLWAFMGYSKAYNMFTGLIEIIGGLLLLFRRSTTLGALICIAVLSNVVMMNFCFDVPVKLHATNLLLMAIFITVPDMKRLIDFFLRNRIVSAINRQRKFSKYWMNAALDTIKFSVVIYVVYSIMLQVLNNYSNTGDGASKKTPLFGIYTVEKFIKNSDTSRSYLRDTTQWKTLNIFFPKQASVETIDDSIATFNFIDDTLNKKIQIYNDPNYKSSFFYHIPDSTHLVLNGKIKDDSVYILLQKQDLNKYRLLNRKFHWINESPYNK